MVRPPNNNSKISNKRAAKHKKAKKKQQPVSELSQFWSHEEMAELRLDPETRGQYKSHINTHIQLNFAPTAEGLKERLRLKGNGMSVGKAKALRTALIWHAERQGQFWSAEDLRTTTNYIKALPAANNNGDSEDTEVSPLPGAITMSMLGPFFKRMGEINKFVKTSAQYSTQFITDAIFDLSVTFITGLRSCQARSLVKNQFKPEEGSFVLTVDKIHEPNRHSKSRRQLKIKVINHPLYTFWLEERLKEIEDDEHVCPNWNREERYNNIIATVAASLDWEKVYGVKFNGAHCFRRGAIQYVEADAGEDAAAAFAGHTKPPPRLGTTKRYLETNESRATRANRSFAEVISSQSVAKVAVKTRATKVQRNDVKKKAKVSRRTSSKGRVLQVGKKKKPTVNKRCYTSKKGGVKKS